MARRRIRLAVVVYGLLSVAAVAWGLLQDQGLYHHPAPWVALPFPRGTILSLALGAGVGLLVVRGTRALVRRTHWARTLHVEFRQLLGPLSQAEIVTFAVTSGVAEEMFFRGAMQPALGLVVSSVIFGAVHIGPNRRYLPWTVWAIAMGFVFGGLYVLTGELLAPITAHVLINYENLHFVEAYDPCPAGPSSRRPGPAALVSSRLRSGGRAR